MISYSVIVEADHPFYRTKKKNVVVLANSSDEAIQKYREDCEFQAMRNKGYTALDVVPTHIL